MKYKNIIFDLDNTLIDNKLHMINVLKKIAGKYALPEVLNRAEEFYYSENKFWQNYKIDLKAIPQQYKTDKEKVEYVRSIPFFKFFNIDEKVIRKIQKDYIKFLGEDCEPFGDVKTALKILSKSYNIYVASNEAVSAIIGKLKTASIYKFFKGVFSAEEVMGEIKPSAAYFNGFIKKFNLNKSESVMAGDSLINDCKGAMDAGLDAVWVNRKNLKDEQNIKPAYMVTSLAELPEILNKDVKKKKSV